METKNPPIPSPATPPPDSSSNGLPKSFADLEGKRRGTPAGAKRGPYKKGGAAPGPVETVDNLPGAQFTPENCKYLVELPFNLAFVRTGFTGFLLSEPESATLSASASTVLNVWVHVDPKWAALIMFSISLCSISAAKVMGYKVALAELEAKKGAANGTETPKP